LAHGDEALVNLLFDLKPVRIVEPDEPVGAIQDGLAGAEVLREHDAPDLVVVVQELQHVADRRAAPLVDRVMHNDPLSNEVMGPFHLEVKDLLGSECFCNFNDFVVGDLCARWLKDWEIMTTEHILRRHKQRGKVLLVEPADGKLGFEDSAGQLRQSLCCCSGFSQICEGKAHGRTLSLLSNRGSSLFQGVDRFGI
jgi:hypothetical protein